MPEDQMPPSNQGQILCVDDEFYQRVILEKALKKLGYGVTVASTGKEALQRLRFQTYDVLITDLQMPDMSGIQLIESMTIHDPTVSGIIVTAHGTIETAVEAMKKGAEDYLLKPIEFNTLEVILDRVFKKRALVRDVRRLQTENEALKSDFKIRYLLPNAIGRSEAARMLLAGIQQQMKSRAPLLILGKHGVGKSDVARTIHFNGPWSSHDLIFFDCAKVPAELHSTHLFGDEPGLRYGVKLPGRPGLVEKAHLGTLVISNVHLLNSACQSRLCRVIQEEKTQRMNGKRFYPVSMRLIATSIPEDFERSASSREWRGDLKDLLLKNLLTVPSLEERREDIPVLIASAAKMAATTLLKDIQKIDRVVVERLSKYDFPGDIRELQAMVEAAVIRSSSTTLEIEHFAFPSEEKTR